MSIKSSSVTWTVCLSLCLCVCVCVCVCLSVCLSTLLSICVSVFLSVCMSVGLQVSITGLERELHQYTLEPSETSFDLKSVPLAAEPVVNQQPTAAATIAAAEAAAVKTTDKLAATRHDVYAGQSSHILLCYYHLTA